MTVRRKKHRHSAFCLMFISRELHSGMAHSNTISFNSLSGLFTLGGRAKKSRGWRGGGGSSADTLSHIYPTAANASKPLYFDWKSNKQIIYFNVRPRQTLGGREPLLSQIWHKYTYRRWQWPALTYLSLCCDLVASSLFWQALIKALAPGLLRDFPISFSSQIQ